MNDSVLVFLISWKNICSDVPIVIGFVGVFFFKSYFQTSNGIKINASECKRNPSYTI